VSSRRCQISKFRCEMSRNAIACLPGHLQAIKLGGTGHITRLRERKITPVVDNRARRRHLFGILKIGNCRKDFSTTTSNASKLTNIGPYI
jgi:hypothetical protein